MTISINQAHEEGSLKEPSTIIDWWSSMQKSYLLHSSFLLALDWMRGRQIKVIEMFLQCILKSIIIVTVNEAHWRVSKKLHPSHKERNIFSNWSKESLNKKRSCWNIPQLFDIFYCFSSKLNADTLLQWGGGKWSKKYFQFYSSDKISSARAQTWNWNGAILLRNQKIRFTHE